ncbi:hypothetical protein B0I35DRAFT_426713 [Stachybotrys elegans]|uniref:Uncharacterized protein n=1 Tax=Stachybotrys elegans TaxID=80388 RepID=A0A8K0WT55_9HYPO|nr:hypothetical protein B0I35DRAFT_426713 [Stachybotrys elegans]
MWAAGHPSLFANTIVLFPSLYTRTLSSQPSMIVIYLNKTYRGKERSHRRSRVADLTTAWRRRAMNNDLTLKVSS